MVVLYTQNFSEFFQIKLNPMQEMHFELMVEVEKIHSSAKQQKIRIDGKWITVIPFTEDLRLALTISTIGSLTKEEVLNLDTYSWIKY